MLQSKWLRASNSGLVREAGLQWWDVAILLTGLNQRLDVKELESDSQEEERLM